MALNFVIVNSSSFLLALGISALRATALALCAGLGICLVRPKVAATRLFVWSAVLYAAIAIPLLCWVVPPIAVPMPDFAWHKATAARSAIAPSLSRQAAALQLTEKSPASTEAVQHGKAFGSLQHSQGQAVRPTNLVVGLYLVVAFVLLVRLAVGLTLARRLVKGSRKIERARLREKVLSSAGAAGVSFAPNVYESDAISVPMTVGAFRSTILFPATWREWNDEKLDAVVAHEMSHVARYDALTQCISLLHRAIFWFSPLAWWLNVQLANLAELASDEAALADGANCHNYARTLLEFFEALQGDPRRVWWKGVAMAKAGQAEKRLERILSSRGVVAMGIKKSAMLILVAFAIPVVYLAAAAGPAKARQAQNAPASALPTSSLPSPPSPASGLPTPTVPAAPVSGDYNSAEPPVAPTGPASPSSPDAPAPPDQDNAAAHSERGSSYAYGFDDEQRFVIVTGKSDSFTMSGSSEDARHVEKLRKQISGDFIWFQRDEKSYIIRDRATIERARQLWAPQQELGKKQEELGKKQEELGKQQAELGDRMRQIQVKVPDMTAELDKLRAEMKQLSGGANAEQVGKLQAEIGELQAKMGQAQSQAGDQQSKLGEEMGALGEKQGKLGQQQGELGRQQAELAEHATRKMKELLEDAIKKGMAQPEPATPDSASL